MSAKTLLVSSDSSLQETIAEAITSVSDRPPNHAACLSEAKRCSAQIQPSVIFFHIANQQDFSDAVALLNELADRDYKTHFVALANNRDAAQAIALLQAGAADYLVRPLSLTRIAMLTDVLSLRARPQSNEMNSAETEVETLGNAQDFLYASPVMRVLVSRAQRVARLDSTVLLTGETGTGKTRLARLIHELSGRTHEPFVCVNCGALTETLIESDLFGHLRGAFTGAERERAGKCATAGAGTLLLDDVDALPLATQAKLLRAVDERLFEPVGSDQSSPLKARLIFATNQSLDQAVREQRFRADLYYRINVLALRVPPLRERREEIASLATVNLQRFAKANGTQIPRFSPAAEQAMFRYDWPGNIRELRNAVERAIAFGGHQIELADLPDALQRASVSANRGESIGKHHNGHAVGTSGSVSQDGRSKLDRSRSRAESQVIVDALSRNANNRSHAARTRDQPRHTL